MFDIKTFPNYHSNSKQLQIFSSTDITCIATKLDSIHLCDEYYTILKWWSNQVGARVLFGGEGA